MAAHVQLAAAAAPEVHKEPAPQVFLKFEAPPTCIIHSSTTGNENLFGVYFKKTELLQRSLLTYIDYHYRDEAKSNLDAMCGAGATRSSVTNFHQPRIAGGLEL